MISKVFNKKFFIVNVLMLSVCIAKSQIRTDGYYSNTRITEAGDTTFHIIYFASDGSWTDTSGRGVAPNLVRVPIGRSNEKCTYSRNGNELALTVEPINLPLYHVSNCPCKYRIRIENDGILVIDWEDSNKNRKNIKEKHLFVPFRNNN